MARGDSHVDMYINLATNGTTLIRPADGDEWLLVMHFSTGGLGSRGVNSGGTTGSWKAGLFGGQTTAGDVSRNTNVHPIKYALKYTEYFQLHNNDGGTQQVGYSAVETK